MLQPMVCRLLHPGKRRLKSVAEAKARLEPAGKEISDEAIEAEIKLMYKEKQGAALKFSPLFRPAC